MIINNFIRPSRGMEVAKWLRHDFKIQTCERRTEPGWRRRKSKIHELLVRSKKSEPPFPGDLTALFINGEERK